MQLQKEQKDRINHFIYWLAPVLLTAYCLRHITLGVEWWDTAYNYGNFRFVDHMDPMWFFSTFLANIVGHMFTLLPGGSRMLGMNVYTGLFTVALVLIAYFFLTRVVKIPSLIVFIGEVIAIGCCWCPTAVLYNYMTYLFMELAVICLYMALQKEKDYFFVIAGMLLGVNVFVRFSNLAEISLIVGVWAYGIIQKKKLLEIIKQTAWCVLGYIVGLAVMAGIIFFCYGIEKYVGAITRLFGMTSDASDYTLTSMIIYLLQNIIQNVKWLVKIVLCMLAGTVVYGILPKKLEWIKKIGYCVCIPLLFYYLMNQDMFNMKYSTKLSIFQWAVFAVTFMIMIGAVVIFNPKADKKDKLLCGFSLLVALITAIGSNNHLYSSINNLFLVAPVVIWMMWRFLKAVPEKMNKYMFPVKAMICAIGIMLLIQSIGFGFGYVFSEADGGENLTTRIENNDILKGMYTDAIRDQLIESISVYVTENQLKEHELILFGNIPALSYYLDMPFAISAWPDLASYNYEVMKKDMDEVQLEVDQGQTTPVVILERKYGEQFKSQETISEDNPKWILIIDYMNKNNYQLTFENDKFMLFEKKGNL